VCITTTKSMQFSVMITALSLLIISDSGTKETAEVRKGVGD